MYEEDRVRALEMYDTIFEEVGNETAVLQMLVSPTRQAVNLARAYDARERKYQGDDEQEPAYLLVIEELRRQANTLVPEMPKLDDGQLSLFSDAEAEENVFESLGFDTLPERRVESDEMTELAPQEITHYPDEDKDGEPAAASSLPVIVPEQPEEDEGRAEIEDFSDAVDAFLADFAISDELSDAEAPEPEQQPITQIKDEDTPTAAQPQRAAKLPEPKWPLPPQEESAANAPAGYKGSRGAADSELPDLTGTTERRANVPLLILFILVAIPVGLLCVALILPVAALFLSLAAGSLAVGFGGLAAAFGFSVFADILLVFGLSLALSAIGLLLLWIFIWLLAGAIPGLVRGICALARKLCYREVSV